MITSLHFVYLAQSWNLIFGYTGQLALGHGVFYGIAGYFSTKLFLAPHVTPYLGGVLGALAGALFAVPLGDPVSDETERALSCPGHFRRHGDPQGPVQQLEVHRGFGGDLSALSECAPGQFLFMSRLPYYFIALFMVLGMILLTLLIEKSKLGHQADCRERKRRGGGGLRHRLFQRQDQDVCPLRLFHGAGGHLLCPVHALYRPGNHVWFSERRPPSHAGSDRGREGNCFSDLSSERWSSASLASF